MCKYENRKFGRCLVLVLIGLIGLALIVKLISLPSVKPIRKSLATDEAKLLIKKGIPEDVIISYGKNSVIRTVETNDLRIRLGVDTAVISSSSEWKIIFEDIESLGGHWIGESPVLTFLSRGDEIISNDSCYRNLVLEGKSRTRKWNAIHGHNYSVIWPYMEVKVPAPDSSCYHNFFPAKASMDLIYPSLYESGYKNNTLKLERLIFFYVVNQEEVSLFGEIFPKNRIPLWLRLILIGSVLFLFGIVIYGFWPKISNS
jgi:hypothetical protein